MSTVPATEEVVALRRQLVVFATELGQLYRLDRRREAELQGALRELHENCLSIVRTLAFVVEARDITTRTHLDRCYHYGLALTRLMAPELAERPESGYGFLLHDIGKIGVPEAILRKTGPLTEAEREVMRTHPVIGAQIVAPIDFLRDTLEVIRHHHERYDGLGYPAGLKGRDIPLLARIFSVVDAFDAMTSDRPYQEGIPVERALAEVARHSGTQFDPEVVEAFLILVEGLDELPAAEGATVLQPR